MCCVVLLVCLTIIIHLCDATPVPGGVLCGGYESGKVVVCMYIMYCRVIRFSMLEILLNRIIMALEPCYICLIY